MTDKTTREPLIEFNPKLPKLSKNESKVLKLLIEAGKLVVSLYKLQENKQFPGANFYPHDATKEEIQKAAKKEPLILSPYTVVERVEGKLVAVPYHVKYAKFLKPIADKLEEAAGITDNREFGEALKIQAKAMLDGSYDKATIAWLKMPIINIDISIGPNDFFDDQLFSVKTSYQAWIGVLDKEGTDRLNNYKSIILGVRREGLIPTERVNNYDKIKAKVIDTILFSGMIARTKFQGVNYPIDVNIVEKYGSEITLFNQPSDLMVQEEIVPILNQILSEALREEYDLEDLKRGNLRYTAMHELAHSYLYYRHASENLKDLFWPIYELAAILLGFRLVGSLLLKDRINSKQLESMIIVFLGRSFYLIKNKDSVDKTLSEYVLGSTIFINFLTKSGALKTSNGTVTPNFMKAFVALQDLSSILERLLSGGSRQEAAAFIEKYTH